MAKIASPFWAILLAVLGVTLALTVLFHHAEQTTANAVLQIASNLVSGALGAFAGHVMTAKSDVTKEEDSAILNSQSK